MLAGAGYCPAARRCDQAAARDGWRDGWVVGHGAGQPGLGLAIGTGTDAAIEASDLTLVLGDPLAVPGAIALSRCPPGSYICKISCNRAN